MKKISLILVFLLIIFLTGCDSPTWEKVGSLEVTNINMKVSDFGSPMFTGTIRNDGNVTVYNASINFTIYDSDKKEVIIDTAWGYLANGNDIKVGQSTNFEAIAFDLESVDSLKHYEYEISFLTR